MIYIKAIAVGLFSLLLAFLAAIVWVYRQAKHGESIGFTPAHLILPRMLVIELVIFVMGAAIFLVLQRKH